MKKNGKVVSLYLIDGEANGMICSYLSNWTGQAIKIPRSKLQESLIRPELTRPGIYLLIEKDEIGKDKIYVGESEFLSRRLGEHFKNKEEYFNEIVAFSSKDEELTKSHIKYLEEHLIKEISKNSIYDLKNKRISAKTQVSELSEAILKEYLKNVKIILPTLGYFLFLEKKEVKKREVLLNYNKIQAKGIWTLNGEIIVLKGSQINEKEHFSLANGYKKLRQKLIENNIISLKSKTFLEDYTFKTPSSAAVIIIGCSINGREKWKINGKSIKEVEKELVIS